MSVNYLHFFIFTFTACFIVVNTSENDLFLREKLLHKPNGLSDEQVRRLSSLSNVTHINEILDHILFPRVVGTQEHERVKGYIIKSMEELGWNVETDKFTDRTPIFGVLTFENIIAKLNPNARRYLTLACHYDSKYFKDEYFVGATDSAVPCSQLINLAYVMNKHLQSIKNQEISLMFIFFDGEEAFLNWNSKDSIYGAKHLARKWHRQKKDGTAISELQRIDILVLLDLIGAPDPTFYNYFPDTEKWYSMLITAEKKLAKLRHFEEYSYGKPQQFYFQPYSVQAFIDDDHIPFLRKNVPIVHLIPHPFPSTWHTPADNRANIDMSTTENINKILRVFVASYLHISV